ncbi:MAG: hypothetical protein Q7T53_04870 [Deltaproteobacteria bacterium]|nr:hypothetical protein [Deltaproteobacteria bacterium]
MQLNKIAYIGRVVLLSLILAVVSVPILDLIFDQDKAASRIATVLSEENVDILFFGDTVIRAYESGEKNTGIDSLLADKGHYAVLSAANSGTGRSRARNPEYSPIVYQDYIDIVARSIYKPKAIIIPINLQSFSESWFSDPRAQFHLERLKARLRYVRFSKGDFMEYLEYKLTDKLEREDSLWINSEVIYGDVSLGVRGKIDYESRIAERSFDYDDLKIQIKLMKQFEYNYMNIIERRHKMFDCLDKTIDTARANGIKVVCYITPINFEDGGKYAGDKFTKRVKNNVAIINQYLNDKGIDYLDMSFSLSSSHFMDKFVSSARLNLNGRTWVANELNYLIASKLKGRGN